MKRGKGMRLNGTGFIVVAAVAYEIKTFEKATKIF